MPTQEEGGLPPAAVPPVVITDFGQGGGGGAVITIDPPSVVPPSLSLSGQATVILPVFQVVSLSGQSSVSETPVQIRTISLSTTTVSYTHLTLPTKRIV